MNKKPIDMLLDENNSDPIVFYNEKNEPIRFDQIAVVPLKGETYAILKPLDMSDILAEDEAMVFAIVVEDGEELLSIVDDDDIIDAVFEVYYAMLAEAGII